MNILHRGSDSEITRFLKYAEVRTILLVRTVRYLASIGKSVSEALNLGWLNLKFRAEALRLEAEYHKCGVLGTVKLRWVGEVPCFTNVPNDNHQRMKPAI
ncbi:hypothetical protein [Coleofasciculus sp. F4-SAH-05]|uniref:hypothetical protein n=1 Tax=Coleofasciculus sp. F4-SAH-05 TaxID=3069525 RepID=UPI0032F7972B